MSDEVSEAPVESQEEPVVEAVEDQQTAEKPEVDVEAAVSKAVDAAMAALSARLDERLPKPVEEKNPEDPAAMLEASQNRVAELESALQEHAVRAAVQENAAAAGVNAAAVLDSSRGLAALKDVDLSDGKAVARALKEVSDIDGMGHLKAVTHARVPKASGEKPGGRPSGMTLDTYKSLDYLGRQRFKNDHPAEYRALMGEN